MSAGQRPAMAITIEPMISVRTDRNAASPYGARWLLKCGGENLDAQMSRVGCSLAGAASAARARRVGDRGELQTRRFRARRADAQHLQHMKLRSHLWNLLRTAAVFCDDAR